MFMCCRVFEVVSMPLKIPFPMIITGFMSRMRCLEVEVISKIVVRFAWLTKEKIDNILRFYFVLVLPTQLKGPICVIFKAKKI